MASILVPAALLRVSLFSGGCKRVGPGCRDWWGDKGGEGEGEEERDNIGGSVE